jgi:hypothetical protein
MAPKKRNAQTNRIGNKNAGQTYIDYWKELTRLWVDIVPNAKRLRHKHSYLQSFLRACSQPVFRTATTDNALSAFTDRHIRQSNV